MSTATISDLTENQCIKNMLPIRDALDVLAGKWKLPIIVSLMHGNRRFKEIARGIPHITDRMLSKELKELEANELIKRIVFDTQPVLVEYCLTAYGETLLIVIEPLREWGSKHRERLMKRQSAI